MGLIILLIFEPSVKQSELQVITWSTWLIVNRLLLIKESIPLNIRIWPLYFPSWSVTASTLLENHPACTIDPLKETVVSLPVYIWFFSKFVLILATCSFFILLTDRYPHWPYTRFSFFLPNSLTSAIVFLELFESSLWKLLSSSTGMPLIYLISDWRLTLLNSNGIWFDFGLLKPWDDWALFPGLSLPKF